MNKEEVWEILWLVSIPTMFLGLMFCVLSIQPHNTISIKDLQIGFVFWSPAIISTILRSTLLKPIHVKYED